MPRLVVTLLLVVSLIALGAGSARAEVAQPSASLPASGSSIGTRAMPPSAPGDPVTIDFVSPTPANGSAQKDRQVRVDPDIENEPDDAVVTYQLNSLTSTGTVYTCGAPDNVWTDCEDWTIEFSDLPDNRYTLLIQVYAANGVTLLKDASTVWTIDNIAPTVAFVPSTPTPPNYVDQSPATITFSVNDGALGSGVLPAEVDCSLDNNGSFPNCSSASTYNVSASLSEGAHDLRVRATDRAGNETISVRYQWFIDKTLPTVDIPNSIDATIYTNGTFTFTFTGSDSGSGVRDYTCMVFDAADDYVVEPVNCGGAVASSSYLFDASGLQTGIYTFKVVSTDKVNRASNPDERTVVVDKTAPDTTLTTTGLETVTDDTSTQFTFSGTDGPSSPVTFECRLEGSPTPPTWSDCTSPSNQTVPGNGVYTFRVRAKDRAGNVDASPPSFTWRVDASDPQLLVETPTQTTIFTKSSVLTFRYSATDTPSNDGLTFICSLNGQQELCNSGVKTYALVEGPSTFVLTVRDAAGNEDSETYTLYVDYTEPTTNLLSGQSNPNNNPNPTFSFSGGDNLTSIGELQYQCSLDASPWVPCSSGLAPFLNITDGMHTFQVRAIDKVGNFDTTPPRFTWRVDLFAPETTIDQKPNLFTPSTSATFTFAGTDAITGTGVVGYECQFDGGAWNACTSPRTLNSVVNGQHIFNVRSRDRAGNTDATPATHTWTVDTIAPPTPSITLPVSGTVLNAVHFVFNGTDNGTGPTRFDCSITLDGQPDAWTTCTSPFQPTGLPEGTYWVKVRMVDQAGNASPAAARRFILDQTPPDTSMTAGIGAPVGFPTFTKETTATFSFTATKSRANENQTFTCKLDTNAPVTPCSSPQTFAGPFGAGRHTFTVSATDDAGNAEQGDPAVFTWTVDTQVPNTVFVPPTQPQYRNEPQPTIQFRGEDIEEAPGVPGSGVVAFDCEFDGQTISPCAPADPSGNGSFTPAAPLADGPHELKLFAIDAVGRKNTTPTVYSWTQDTVVPDTTNLVRTPPDAVTTNQIFTLTFDFSGTEAVAPTFECKLDDADWMACVSPFVTPALDNGAHTFQVRVKDAAGNVDATPLRDSWVVDRAGPVVTITGKPNTATNLTNATFTFSANDNEGSSIASAECRIDNEAWQACSTLSISFPDLAEGDHTFHVRATDELGNVGAAVTYSWTVDRTAPDTAMTGDLPAVINIQSITLQFIGTDALTAEGLEFECSLDNGPFENCISPRTFPGLTNGDHNLRVRAIDGAGNIDQTPATHQWKVEVANPIRQIHLPLVKK
ncbi:MAG TPA: hypothetical protein VFS21_39095 [Roseiflexaceae bacterium]|nr:hypothetical protein [Roseiflexaceae bacterium]